MYQILIADDHVVTRRGLKEILRDEFSELQIAEASNSAETLEKISTQTWDLLLLDIVMPGLSIIEILTQIRRLRPTMPILVLTAIAEMEYVVRTLKAGANGYINKQYAAEELITAVKTVLSGQTYLSREAVTALAVTLREENSSHPHSKLSERELQVFNFIARGKTVKEIGGELNVSEKTVGTYLTRIREKTGLVSYVEITRYALQHRLVE